MQQGLQDVFGRRFSYLRLSVTDACNFRCVYCLPDGYKRPAHQPGPLELFEIKNLVSAFAEMGTVKVRLTGGEPTLRPDFLKIVQTVRQISGIEKVAVSTNGYRLKQLARPLLEAGATAVNVSVDSLDPEIFAKTTGGQSLAPVLEGIEEALAVGFTDVKINAVLMKGLSETTLADFMSWIRKRNVTVRWIELMPTGQTKDFFKENHLSAAALASHLQNNGWIQQQRGPTAGPAQEYSHPDSLGRMGLIAPYAKDFCVSCNRLRITSQGGLRLCLFGEGNHSLRDLLQEPEQKAELMERVATLLHKKEISHYLTEGKYGNNNTFSAIGG